MPPLAEGEFIPATTASLTNFGNPRDFIDSPYSSPSHRKMLESAALEQQELPKHAA
jgi:hypothetical protein